MAGTGSKNQRPGWISRVVRLAASVMLFGVLIALRAETKSAWLRLVLAACAFANLAAALLPVVRRDPD